MLVFLLLLLYYFPSDSPIVLMWTFQEKILLLPRLYSEYVVVIIKAVCLLCFCGKHFAHQCFYHCCCKNIIIIKLV